MTIPDPPLNDVETVHYDAIVGAGNDPDEWLIESQIATWEQRNGWPLTPGHAADLRRCSEGAASRFELAERLQLYSLAKECLKRMQEMSFDRQAIQPAQFRIATKPGDLLHPYVRAEWHPVPPVDDGVPTRAPVIWVPVHVLTLFGSVVGVTANRLMRQFGGLESLIAAFVRHLTWYEALEILRFDRLPPDLVARSDEQTAILLPTPASSEPPDVNDPIRQGCSVMNIASGVFLIGHEAGHLYMGHFGDREPIEPIVGGDLSPIVRREAGADWTGILAIWDGLPAEGLPIDYAWAGPIMALATGAGLAAAYPRADQGGTNDTWQDWLHRLDLAVRGLGEGLLGNRYGMARSAPILGAAAPLAACVYEYVRTGGDLADEDDRLGAPGADVYATLEETALQILHRF